jgi:hypothetical protein
MKFALRLYGSRGMVMHPPRNTPIAPSTHPALELIGLAKLSPDLARRNLRAILLANPNYFGNLSGSSFKAVLKIQEDTTYESIGFVGYNPQLEQLLATVIIKQESGYSGGICAAGSNEYLRFYLSYDGGSTWRDQGSRAVIVSDVPGPKPLEFAVSIPIGGGQDICFLQDLPRVRAILSWNCPPPAGDANWVPVWGNVMDADIQVEGSQFLMPGALLEGEKAAHRQELAEAVEPVQAGTIAPRKKLSPFELHMLYAASDVPEHRYLSSLLEKACAMPGLVIRQGVVSKSTRRLASLGGISRVDLLSLVERWLNTCGDTTYEEIRCVGLDPATNQLSAVVEIKQSRGYCGDLGAAGSNEYVAFWVDWGSGWEYAGTSFAGVHDLNTIPAGGISYGVFLPVDLPAHVKPSIRGAQTARVRAVLSWSTRPSTTDPDALAAWGNRVEATVLVSSGQIAETDAQTPAESVEGSIDFAKRGGAHIAHEPLVLGTFGMERWRRPQTLLHVVWERTNADSGWPGQHNRHPASRCLETGT